MIPSSGPQLYDLQSDPGERRDLAADQPQRIEAMIERYKRFVAAVPAPPPVAEVELEHEDQPFKKPEWVSEEVSGDPKYFNSNLIQNPYSKW